MSLIIPTVFGIYIKIGKQVTSTVIASNVKQLLLDSIVKRLFPYEQRQTLQIATLLDPRMKAAAFHLPDNLRNGKKLFQELLSSVIEQEKRSTEILQPSPSTSAVVMGQEVSESEQSIGILNFKKIVYIQ